MPFFFFREFLEFLVHPGDNRAGQKSSRGAGSSATGIVALIEFKREKSSRFCFFSVFTQKKRYGGNLPPGPPLRRIR